MKVLASIVVFISAAPASAAENNGSVDSGGARATSTIAAYGNDGCIGGIGGVSTASDTTTRHGYIGQLYEVALLNVEAAVDSVNETATTQLHGTALMDDDTIITLTGSEIAWTAPAWPLVDITAAGIASAAVVYANTSATLNGSYLGVAGSASLLVLDTISDNFGSYAGDGLNDSWQNQYFGLDNPDASPLADPDGDNQNNRFEFTAGVIPTDPLSLFRLCIEPVVGEPTQKRLVFSPRLRDRTYTPLFSTSLLAQSWQSLTQINVSDNDTERTITDVNASHPTKFYRIQITAP